LAHEATPLAYRVLFAFLAREGCREGEALAFQVRDFNLVVGNVRLDENKTDDPRSWALDPSVTVALRRWVALRDLKPNDHMFVDDNGGPLTLGHRLAERLRADLVAAGVERYELHHDGKNTGKLRMHDLRGSFVTISLANGKTETWVCDRTGHKSSGMVNRYRKQAREAHELNLGELAPMDQAIPELRPDCPATAPEKAGSPVTTAVSQGYGVLRFRAEVPHRAHRL
jgi:integrase